MKSVVLCASTMFYDHVAQLADELEANGFKSVVPIDVENIRRGEQYDATTAKTWYENPEDFRLKGDYMRDHFNKIVTGDILLVVNDEKHGVPGYIGPNVLMEMGLAFHLHKPIYVLNAVSKDMPTYEEVFGMGSVILEGDLTKISA